MKDSFPSVTSSVTHTVTETRKKLELLGTDALTSLNFLELDTMYLKLLLKHCMRVHYKDKRIITIQQRTENYDLSKCGTV